GHRRENDPDDRQRHARRRPYLVDRQEAPLPAQAEIAPSPRWRKEIGIECPGRRDKFAQQAGRYRADRVDRDARRTWRPDRFVGDPEKPFLVAPAKEQTDNRYLPEHVVEAVERHERTAQVHFIARIIDIAFD